MSEDNNKQNLEPDEVDQENSGIDVNSESLPDEAELIEDDVEVLRQELEGYQDKMLRLAAEFENYKKRMERERDITLKYAGENILRELLNTLDNLDRALDQGTSDSTDVEKKLNGMVEGVDLTRKGLLSTLEKFEVRPVESVGLEFDPNEHEALAMEPSAEVPVNHVLQEFAKGYRFKDRLLRAAKVIVSKGNK